MGLEDQVDVRPWASKRFGTAGPAANLFQQVWEGSKHVFAAEGGGVVPASTARELGLPEWTSPEVLN